MSHLVRLFTENDVDRCLALSHLFLIIYLELSVVCCHEIGCSVQSENFVTCMLTKAFDEVSFRLIVSL